jgi:Uma2 family endonuclease
MSMTRSIGASARRVAPPAPPLRDGDRMGVDEFLRRWEAMPAPRPRAELLEGRVWLDMAPISVENHDHPQVILVTMFGNYEAATPGVRAGGSASMKLAPRHMPQPDAFLRVLPSHGGRVEVTDDDYLADAPDLVVEVAASTVRKDTTVKFDIYRRAGVREYVVWKTERGDIDWFVRREDRFDPMPADDDGIFRSETFPGLWADSAALLQGDTAGALATLRRGLASPEHKAFVKKLKRAAARPSERKK